MFSVRRTAAITTPTLQALIATTCFVRHRGGPRGYDTVKPMVQAMKEQTIMRWRPVRPHNPVSDWLCSWATSWSHCRAQVG
ncbi:hypothetical protein V8C44DRAFT_318803 [Trichoderma aethiopicum]